MKSFMGWATHLVFQQAKMNGREPQTRALNIRTLQIMWNRWNTSLIDQRINRRNDALAFQFFIAHTAHRNFSKWRSISELKRISKHVQASCFRKVELTKNTNIYREMCVQGDYDKPNPVNTTANGVDTLHFLPPNSTTDIQETSQE